MSFKTALVFIYLLLNVVFANAQTFGYKFPITYTEGEILENEPGNAKNLSFVMAPVDFKHLMNNLRFSATGELSYRTPKERFLFIASYSYDYFILYGNKVLESRPKNSKPKDYELPSFSYKSFVGYNFIIKRKNQSRAVVIAGRLKNLKTVAIIPVDLYKCLGVHVGFDNFTRYVYAPYAFDKDPTINLNNGINPINYSQTNVESYASVSYAAFGIHYQSVDDIKIKVKYKGADKIRTNKAVAIYYIDLLFPTSRSFKDANLVVGVDSNFATVSRVLPVSSFSPLSKMGFRAGVRTTGLGLLGTYYAGELAFLPGPKSIFYNLMLNAKIGFSINFKAKKSVK